MKILIIIPSIFLVSCNSPKIKDSAFETQVSSLSDGDSVTKVDSMKWYYYAMNYRGQILFYDNTSKNKYLDTMPIECDIKLETYYKVNNDTAYYYFSFVRKGMSFKYVMIGEDGLATYNGIIYPMKAHLSPSDYLKIPDSAKADIAKRDNEFRIYLKNYKGKLSPWLRQEAIRRKVLQVP